MNTVAFRFQASLESNDHEVRPTIDGVDTLHEMQADTLGIDPPEFFAQHALVCGGRLLIGRCSCGVVGCSDMHIEVSVIDDLVTWQLGLNRSFRFEREDYLTSVNNAAADRNWESVERTAERLVSAVNFKRVQDNGYEFGWASARIAKGRITLSFVKAHTQKLFEIGWDDQSPEDALKQVTRWANQFA